MGGLLRLCVLARGLRLRSAGVRRLRGWRADWGRSVGRLEKTACHVAIMAACVWGAGVVEYGRLLLLFWLDEWIGAGLYGTLLDVC